jgi:hypothetical protein
MSFVIKLFRKFSKVGGSNMSFYAFGDSFAVRPKAKMHLYTVRKAHFMHFLRRFLFILTQKS